MKIKNITLREYSKTKRVVNYDSLLSALKGEPEFCGNKYDISKLSYNVVKSIEKKLREGKTFEDLSQAFQLAFKVTDEEFFNSKIVDFYQARNFLKAEFQRLMIQEKNLLKTDGISADLWEQAGGKSLEPFSILMPLVKLGKIYSIYPFEVGNKPYNEILTLLALHKRSDIVESKLSELTKPKPRK